MYRCVWYFQTYSVIQYVLYKHTSLICGWIKWFLWNNSDIKFVIVFSIKSFLKTNSDIFKIFREQFSQIHYTISSTYSLYPAIFIVIIMYRRLGHLPELCQKWFSLPLVITLCLSGFNQSSPLYKVDQVYSRLLMCDSELLIQRVVTCILKHI